MTVTAASDSNDATAPVSGGRAVRKAESSGTRGRWHSCSEAYPQPAVTVTAGTEVPGASDAEIALMCQAAARFGLPAADAAALFSGAAVSFAPQDEGRAGYTRTGGHHWCTAVQA
jgi:hypothetical protein